MLLLHHHLIFSYSVALSLMDTQLLFVVQEHSFSRFSYVRKTYVLLRADFFVFDFGLC